MKQSIQIIGGKYKGKKIPFPPIENLRPTANRIKETLFNWLMHDIRGSRCLDAFAGSGSLGIEAFSRGATNVVLIEQNAIAYKNLNNFCKSFQSDNISVIHTSAQAYLKKQSLISSMQFDIVFFDPPFSEPFPYDCISYLTSSNLLVENGLIYVEYGQDILIDENLVKPVKQKKSGQVVYGLYTKKTL